MNTRTAGLALVIVLGLATADNLLAQRRTPNGGGSTGRSTPSGGGNRASGGGRSTGGSSNGARPSRGGSGSSATSRPSGSQERPSGSGSVQGNGSNPSSGSGQAQASGSAAGQSTGKIGAAKARARDVQSRTRRGGGVIYGGGVYIGGCYGCGHWGWYGGRWGWYDGGWWYPARRPPRDHYDGESDEDDGMGQGYMPYPYAENDGTGETFVRRRTSERHAFGTIGATYFSDFGSTTQAGSIALEGAYRMLHGDIEYRHYAEPLASRTDHLQTVRFSVGIQPRLGKAAYLIAGFGARGVYLDDGSKAGGPEGTLGVQVFPMRPIGVHVTGRLAGMSWTGRDHFSMSELNTTGSVFLGRVELQAGWHWMKMQGSPAFGGPVVGTRIWF